VADRTGVLAARARARGIRVGVAESLKSGLVALLEELVVD